AANGAWGKQYTFAVTSFVCLSYLSSTDEPFTGDRGKALVKGLNFLMANQKDGQFTSQGHSWIHGQGFATLALSEAYGRSLFAKGFDYLKKCQTANGGFNYQLGDGRDMHEGTCGGMATLGLMKKFDNQVMIKAYEFLQKLTPGKISSANWPYYGHFYGCMGM